jgi:hypothetical protein
MRLVKRVVRPRPLVPQHKHLPAVPAVLLHIALAQQPLGIVRTVVAGAGNKLGFAGLNQGSQIEKLIYWGFLNQEMGVKNGEMRANMTKK